MTSNLENPRQDANPSAPPRDGLDPERLKELLALAGIRHYQLAERVGKPGSWISRFFNGRIDLTTLDPGLPRYLQALMEALEARQPLPAPFSPTKVRTARPGARLARRAAPAPLPKPVPQKTSPLNLCLYEMDLPRTVCERFLDLKLRTFEDLLELRPEKVLAGLPNPDKHLARIKSELDRRGLSWGRPGALPTTRIREFQR